MRDFGALLRPEIQEFIVSNTGSDVTKLALRPNPFPEVDYTSILQQISARTKAKDKLQIWFGTENVVYPSKISVEQTSSETTAEYKSKIVNGDRLADLTGGFGVDAHFFSRAVKEVIHIERDASLSEISKHNFRQLGVNNIVCVSDDSTEWLKKEGLLDWIYIDPSRRNDAKGKVFLLQDCLPDVPHLLDFYFQHTSNILIKTAPLLDISAGLSELHSVKEIHVVAVENEVKELVWMLEKKYTGAPEIKTVNLSKSGDQIFGFRYDHESQPAFSPPLHYLYESNAAIMKAAGYDALAVELQLNKLALHSHLLTSDELSPFHGRTFDVLKTLPYSKNEMQELKGKKANVTTRNFPETVEDIRKKWKISDGGDLYCFFTTDAMKRKIVVLCAKITNDR